ncbi:MAG TPA: hypothetical protein VGM25_03855 [Caulobacteraceae bacterium]|jgi:hypothetical protein
MVWALRSVFMLIPDSHWEPGGRIDPPPPPQPFDAFRAGALSLASPLRIVRSRITPTRRRKFRVA